MDSEIYLHSWYIEIAQRIISVEVLNLFNTCQRNDGYNYYLFFFSYTLRSILSRKLDFGKNVTTDFVNYELFIFSTPFPYHE